MIRPPKRSHPRETNDGYESDEAEMHGLVRVTVITRRKKKKVFHVPDCDGGLWRQPYDTNSGSVSALAVARGVIHNKPTLSRSNNMHPRSNYPRAYTHSMTGLRSRRNGGGSSRLAENDYSSLLDQSLIARRKAEPHLWGMWRGTHWEFRNPASSKRNMVVIVNHSVRSTSDRYLKLRNGILAPS